MSCRMRGLLVTIPEPRGKKSLENEAYIIRALGKGVLLSSYLPTKFSNTELLPAL